MEYFDMDLMNNTLCNFTGCYSDQDGFVFSFSGASCSVMNNISSSKYISYKE